MLSLLARVGGIGDGLFVIFFFVALSVLICAIGLRTDRPGIYCAGATCLSLFIILLLVLVPKAPPGGGSSSDDGRPYDHTAGLRKGVCVILGIFLVASLGCVCSQIVMQPIQGSRIRTA